MVYLVLSTGFSFRKQRNSTNKINASLSPKTADSYCLGQRQFLLGTFQQHRRCWQPPGKENYCISFEQYELQQEWIATRMNCKSSGLPHKRETTDKISWMTGTVHYIQMQLERIFFLFNCSSLRSGFSLMLRLHNYKADIGLNVRF